ncbi:MAG TPA: proline dehydrogenase family protein [Candidatus Acidoferrum sp.]|nr:proline dehydrogenase family protein [Candidatus Acidoferrum sp.]
MPIMRTLLLAAAQNRWLRDHASHYKFVRRTVSRFMPGESLDEALTAAQLLRAKNIAAVFTHLGENIADREEARQVTEHYLGALEQIHNAGNALPMEISVKLTQLGLDLDPELCFANLQRVIEREKQPAIVWIDMESSEYVERTLAIYRRAKAAYPNVGICLQAYLHRTRDDLASLLPLRPAIRLVKGAYNEPPHVAFASKAAVDNNYFALAQQMLEAQKAGNCSRAAFGTHDVALIRRLAEYATSLGMPVQDFEVQMLYGIQRAEQERLARAGCRSVVLVAYGTFWYPWFMRRLAERPANLWFMVRNLFAI